MAIDKGLTRRGVLVGASALPLAFAVRPAPAQGTPAYPPEAAPGIPPGFPRQDPRRVKETVGLSHRDLAKVQALVEETPALANATWDWGFGDWESALGAASHTGRREIAEYLISKGARPTLFSAAMLGQLDVVRAFVQSTPASRNIAGPHGIPLIAHARAGGDPAREVVKYLESLEPALAASAAAPPVQPVAEEQLERYFGRYSYGKGESEVLEVAEQADFLAFLRADGVSVRLIPKGGERFHPPGAPAVSVSFQVDKGAVTAVTIEDGALKVTALRIGS
jgi:hypothetical protein